MALTTKTALGIAAGVCGTLFLGYCVYFDHKRRSDPNFKRKLRIRRKQEKLKDPTSGIADLKDTDAIQGFFLQQIQLGEIALTSGDVEKGVEHLCAAVCVCGQPQQLIHVLRQTLPRHVYHLLLQRLPFGPRVGQPPIVLAEDELE